MLWILCVIGSWAILPYSFYLTGNFASISLMAALGITLQSMLLYALILWLSKVLIFKTDLRPFSFLSNKKSFFLWSLISGCFLGGLILLCDQFVFTSSKISTLSPPFWTGLLASIYGAINEEVILRLFLLTLFYYLLGKMFKSSGRTLLLWISTFLSAIFFGLGHLPIAFKAASVSPLEIVRILFLNGICGMIIGWLYWSKGFWAAVLAHFIADLIIHL